MTLPLLSLLLPLLGAATAAAAPAPPGWRCEPAAVPACRPVTVTCRVGAADGDGDGDDGRWTYTWDFGDGGGAEHAGPVVRRVLPAGVAGYAVTRTARRGDTVVRERRALPLDAATLAACPGLEGPPALPPVPSRPPSGLRVAAISDSNGPYGAVAQGADAAAAAHALATRLRPDVVVHVGDMVAGQKRGLAAARVRAMWDGYFDTVAAPLAAAGIPLLPVPGNHDAAAGRRLVDREVYAAVWADRRPTAAHLAWVDAAGWPFRWAARVDRPGGSALLVALDAPTGRLAAADVTWLGTILAGAADDDVRLVFAHVPPWQPTDRGYGTLKRWGALAPVLRDGDVAALVTGHYEVFFPAVVDGVEVVLDGALARACAPRRDLATDAPGHTGGCRCRPLAGSPLCQGSSFVVFDVVAGAVARRFAVHGPTFDRVFPTALLPATVNGRRRADGWL